MQMVIALMLIMSATALFHYISLIAVTRNRFKKYGIVYRPMQLIGAPAMLSYAVIRGLFNTLPALSFINRRRIVMVTLLAYPVLATLLAVYTQSTEHRTLNWEQVSSDVSFIQHASRLFN